MTCTYENCPFFNFDMGPFKYTDEDLKKVSDEFQCSVIMARICASTTPDGVIHDEEALDIVYNGPKEEENDA